MKHFKVILLILSLICLISCNNIEFEKYNGEDLTIGVIGEIPEVREENITFKKITFQDLEETKKLNHYDAIFITKENLEEASNNKYASIYKECIIPFFFIENIKGHLPFVDENFSYEDASQAGNLPVYATGILRNNNELIYNGYGLYDDIESKENIEAVYSIIFKDISDSTGK